MEVVRMIMLNPNSSPDISLIEIRNFLDICCLLYEAKSSLVVILRQKSRTLKCTHLGNVSCPSYTSELVWETQVPLTNLIVTIVQDSNQTRISKLVRPAPPTTTTVIAPCYLFNASRLSTRTELNSSLWANQTCPEPKSSRRPGLCQES